MKIQSIIGNTSFGISKIKPQKTLVKMSRPEPVNYALSDNFISSMKTRVQSIKPGCAELVKLENGDIIGTVQYSIETVPNVFLNFLPDSWFKKCKSGDKKVKPFFWIDKIILDAEKRGNGLGREAMKRLYLESVQRGCEGRMMCYTDWGSYGYYAQTGWEIVGKEGCIASLEEKIARHTLKVKELSADPSNKDELEFSKSVIKNCKEELKKVKLGLPYQDDTIIFNPTKKNVAKLFGIKNP